MILLKRCMKEDFPFFLGDRSEISRYCHATWQIQAGQQDVTKTNYDTYINIRFQEKKQ